MNAVNVVILSTVDEKNLRLIAGSSPGINVIEAFKIWDAPDMVTPERKGDFSSPEYEAILAEAEVMYGFRPPQNFIARAHRLKWFQTMLAGVDHILHGDIVESPVILTNMSGVHATPVGEAALNMVLMFAKRSPFCFQSKLIKRWERFTGDVLRGKTVGIIGLGSIGSEVARLCKAFGMRVVAVRRSARKESRARHVDLLLPRARLHELLCQSDYVVMVLPSTAETYHMVGENELRAMKPSAYLINVGRGNTVDEEMLIKACREKWIAGAGLDAFTVEPLLKESPLWELPNVFFSPHVTGRMTNYHDIATVIFCENLKRYVSGKRLLNVVNKKRGY